MPNISLLLSRRRSFEFNEGRSLRGSSRSRNRGDSSRLARRSQGCSWWSGGRVNFLWGRSIGTSLHRSWTGYGTSGVGGRAYCAAGVRGEGVLWSQEYCLGGVLGVVGVGALGGCASRVGVLAGASKSSLKSRSLWSVRGPMCEGGCRFLPRCGEPNSLRSCAGA